MVTVDKKSGRIALVLAALLTSINLGVFCTFESVKCEGWFKSTHTSQ
jgi:hypothetical protein